MLWFQGSAQGHVISHSPSLSRRLLPPSAKTALMRSPRTALKIKGAWESGEKDRGQDKTSGRGAVLPAGAAAPGGAGRSGPCQGLTSKAMALFFPKSLSVLSF